MKIDGNNRVEIIKTGVRKVVLKLTIKKMKNSMRTMLRHITIRKGFEPSLE
jgi:hypothetical protein